ncbi:MAG: histidine phosphatase family protein [Eubacterium sp.]|nr:histidine phosphatase family protein [Eubacterium sp.]
MYLYFLRHGETDLNKQGGNFQGRIEIPLNEDGLKEAAEAGEDFRKMGVKFDCVYCSPQGRALQTAELASGFPRQNMILDPRLMEMNYGNLEGRLHVEMNPVKFRTLMEDAGNFVPDDPNAESVNDVVARIGGFMKDLAADPPKAENVLVSCHGGTVRAMLVWLGEEDIRTFWGIVVGNCAWFKLELKDGRYKLVDKDIKADRHP